MNLELKSPEGKIARSGLSLAGMLTPKLMEIGGWFGGLFKSMSKSTKFSVTSTLES